MKKALSLVLALVMTVSLFTFSPPTSADAAFIDSNSITYKEAVDVIYALGIMGGYGDGSFRPAGLLTRGAAAKIICSMALTPSIANNMSNNAASKFKDVPAGHTFAGFIAWCVQEGIVSGYSDNTFHPADPLTCQAFLKMLLCALGYDQTIEHYTGSGWSNNVTTRALQIGLNEGLSTTLNGSAQVNRQDACLFAFNALKADLVEYSGTQNRRSEKTSSASSKATSIKNEGSAPYTVQFAEEVFPALKQTANTTDAFGCPATKWTLNNVDVGTYLASVEKVYYNNDVTVGTVYTDLGLTSSANLTFYVNGVPSATGKQITRNSTDKLSSLLDDGKKQDLGNGVEIRAFRNGSEVVLSAVVYYPGTVASVQSATTSRNRRITINGVGDSTDTRSPANLSGNNTFDTEDFEAGDIVAYTFSNMSGNVGVQNVYALGAVRGNLSRLRSGSSLEIDAEEIAYDMNAVFGSAAGSESDLKVGTTYTVYVLTLGGKDMVMWVENVKTSADSYAWVKALNTGRTNFDFAQANLVFSNGSEEIVRLSSYLIEDQQAGEHDIVTYTVDNNNRYTLTPVAKADSAAVENITVRNRTVTPSSVPADNTTIFVVEDKASGSYKVYTGMREMPNVESASAYVYSSDGSAVVVFVTSATITTTKTDLVFIAANSASSPITDKASTYRTFNAVVGGQITKLNVKVDSSIGNEKSGASFTVANNNAKPTAKESVVLDSVDYNGDNLVIGGAFTSASATVGVATGFTAPSGGSIRLGADGSNRGTSMDLSSSVNVYSVSTTGTITKITLNSLRADTDDIVYYTQDNRDITNLFILRVES